MFSIFYLSPLWITGIVFFLNDFFGWYNMLNIFSLYEYCLLFALSLSIPSACTILYFWIRSALERKEVEKRMKEQKWEFVFLNSICTDKKIWETVTQTIQKITWQPVQCTAYVVETAPGKYAIQIIYTIDNWKIGIDIINPRATEEDAKDIVGLIEQPYYKLYEESGLRSGVCSFLKLKEIIK